MSYKLNPHTDLNTSINEKAVTIGTTNCHTEISIEGVSVESVSMKRNSLENLSVNYDHDHNFDSFEYNILGERGIYTIIVTPVNGNQYFATFIY